MADKTLYEHFAKDIIPLVGGADNISNVMNCMTRLRFELNNDRLADEEAIKAHPLVKGVVKQGGQYQVIIGTEVSDIAPLVQQELLALKKDNHADVSKDSKPTKKETVLDKLFKVISGSITPLIGVFVGSGMIRGVLSICTTFGWLTNTSGTYLILYAVADAIMYFMPIFIGFNAGKVFKMNQFVAATIGAAIMYPTLIQAVTEGTALHFMGLPVQLINYSQTLLPVIAAAWMASYIERFFKKVLPQVLQLMFVPAFTMIIAVPLTILVVGPVMTMISGLLSTATLTVFGINPIIGGLLFGAFWQLMVLLGLHGAFIPVLINNLITNGSDPINAILGLTVWALAGVSLGYALKAKDKDEKSLGISNMVSCLCGVTEPTIYSLIVPNFKRFIGAAVAGGISGAILAGFGAKLYAIAGDGLFRLPGMINPQGLDISFYGFVACAALAFVIAAVVTFFLDGNQESK